MRLEARASPWPMDWNANQLTESSKGAAVESGHVNRHTSVVLFNFIASWVDGMGGAVRGIPQLLQTSHPRLHKIDRTVNVWNVILE